MNTRKNQHEKSILYFIPEDEVEKRVLREAWEKGKTLNIRIVSFSSGGDLGVSFKSVKDYELEDESLNCGEKP